MDRTIYFLLYDGRSGSTLLAATLNRYRGICVSRESSFVSRIYSYPKQIRNIAQIPKFVSYLFKELQFKELGLSKNEVTSAINKLPVPYTRETLIKSIIDLYFDKFGKSTKAWIIKHPPFKYLDRLYKIDHNIKFIHIYRDGRAVFNSKKQTILPDGRLMQSNLIKAARDWKKLNDIYFNIDLKNVIHIKYEDFVKNSGKMTQTILNWLNLDESETSISRSNQDYYRNIGNKQKKLHNNVKSAINPKIAGKWKQQLIDYQINAYEMLNKDQLQSYGYQLLFREDKSFSLIIKSTIYIIYSLIGYYLLKVPALIRAIFKNKNLLELLNRRFS